MFKRLAKYLGVVVYGFIISLLVFSCMSFKSHIGVDSNLENNKTFNIEIEKKYKKAGQNFVFLIKEGRPLSKEFCSLVPGGCEPMLMSSASGLVFSSDKNSIFVLTAAHFCVENRELEIPFGERIIGFANDQPRELFILKLDEENDLCMLMGSKFKSDKFYDVKIAQKTTAGEPVYAIAAPLGMGGPGVRLVFKGNLGGCEQRGCITSMAATFGSSGAAIMNNKNEIITIIMAVPEDFQEVILSPSNEALRKFILDIDNEIDIYPY